MCLDSTVFLIEDDAAVRDALSISLIWPVLKLKFILPGKLSWMLITEIGPDAC